MIYYINRYDSSEKNNIKNFSGYEQIVSTSKTFKEVKTNVFLSKIISKIINVEKPKNYLRKTFSKELIVLLKAFVTGNPVFYIYADKDAFLLPLIKRKYNLKRIKIFGTLHWPVEISDSFSFYKHNLASEFNGLIALSSTLESKESLKSCVILHGVDLNFWERISNNYENLYLIIGISNRDHLHQVEIIEKIKKIDNKAKFVLLARDKKIHKYYNNISGVEILKKPITDIELKQLYSKSKAVILIQKFCLASNVVLESIAMRVPLIANRVGDIEEYLGNNYPLFIDLKEGDENLIKFCNSEQYRCEIVNYFSSIRRDFEWMSIVKRTIEFIEKD